MLMRRERSKVYTSVITEENGEAVLPIPEALTEKLHWRDGDILHLRTSSRLALMIENLSVKTMYVSRMQRELNSISRRLGNPVDPLDRVHVKKRRIKRDLNFTVLLSPREWDMLQAQVEANQST